jgi:SAM-dependent methyltransferase
LNLHDNWSFWRPQVQVNPDHYNYKYDDYDRWISYYWQINNIFRYNVNSVLEIGIGHKLVSNYLLSNGIRVTTFDIHAKLGPNCVGSITELPFKDNSFDAVLCASVLEHIPFEHASNAVKEIYRVTRKYAFISIPHFTLTFAFIIRIPVLHMKEIRIRIPYPRKLESFGEHYWECGRPGYPVSKIKKMFKNAEFHIVSCTRPITNYSGCFFILKKK